LILVDNASGQTRLRRLKAVKAAIYKPKARFKLPIFGTVSTNIYHPDVYEVEEVVGLQGRPSIDGRYLHEVISEDWGSSANSVEESWARELLDRGTDPDYFDKRSRTSALEAAIGKDNLAAARLLVAQGASVRGTNRYGGGTALHYAARMNNYRMVAFLLANRARPLARDKQGRTALDVAMIKVRSFAESSPPGIEARRIVELLEKADR
jgi:hypothetical protein